MLWRGTEIPGGTAAIYGPDQGRGFCHMGGDGCGIPDIEMGGTDQPYDQDADTTGVRRYVGYCCVWGWF